MIFTIPRNRALLKAGPYIGPKGGKWADPDHTIAWKEPGTGTGGGGSQSEGSTGAHAAKPDGKAAWAAVAAAKGDYSKIDPATLHAALSHAQQANHVSAITISKGIANDIRRGATNTADALKQTVARASAMLDSAVESMVNTAVRKPTAAAKDHLRRVVAAIGEKYENAGLAVETALNDVLYKTTGKVLKFESPQAQPVLQAFAPIVNAQPPAQPAQPPPLPPKQAPAVSSEEADAVVAQALKSSGWSSQAIANFKVMHLADDGGGAGTAAGKRKISTAAANAGTVARKPKPKAATAPGTLAGKPKKPATVAGTLAGKKQTATPVAAAVAAVAPQGPKTIAPKKKKTAAPVSQAAKPKARARTPAPAKKKGASPKRVRQALQDVQAMARSMAFTLPSDLVKGEARGGKYIKRTPYTDAKGHRKYRYFYRESAVARDAAEGDEVKVGEKSVKVTAVDREKGTVTFESNGRSYTVKHDGYSRMLARSYGDRYHKHAEAKAKQAINAVLRIVPRSMLADLKGDTDSERLADLKKRAPAIHEKLQGAFKRAGVSTQRAKDILQKTLERRGWEPEARAAAVGSILIKRTSASSFDDIIRGAENLAAGSKVEAKHVASIVELRSPGGSEAAFPASVATVAQAAEKELAALSAAMAKAHDGGDKAAAEALALGAASTALQHFAMLMQAFPGLKDRIADKARDALAELPSLTPRKEATQLGSETHVYVAGEGGKPTALKARYKLMNANDVIASHDPTKGFKKRDDYPSDVQERAYHRDQGEQLKVIRNAQGLNPAFVANTNPDAVNGPPMITSDGHALGGNSRAMSMQLAYAEHPERAKALREYLHDHAHEFGFTSDDVAALESPVLVRVVEVEDKSKKNMQLLVRQMNESFTQGMDPRTMQVAMGRKLDEGVMRTFADGMKEDETLNDYLSSSRADKLIDQLRRVGVIDSRNGNQYMNKQGGLNEDGKTLVARILVGRVIGDADLLSNMRPQLLSNVASIVPMIAQAKAHGDNYDMSEDLSTAISAFNTLQNAADNGTISLDPKMPGNQWARIVDSQLGGGLFGDGHAVMNSARAKDLLEVLVRRRGAIQITRVFREYAKSAAQHPEGQGGMFGDAPTPAKLFQSVIASVSKAEEAEDAAKEAEKAAKEAKKKKKDGAE